MVFVFPGSEAIFLPLMDVAHCQICWKTNQTALTCFYRNSGYPSSSNVPPMSAMTAQANSPQDFWIANSSATNHMTADVNNLYIAFPYTSSKAITAANGEGIAISHIGTSTLSTYNHTFQLNAVLHVHKLFTSLLLVNGSSKENHYRCIFDELSLCILDKIIGRFLFRGLSNIGLYPLPFSISPSSSSSVSSATAFLGQKNNFHFV